MHETTVEAVNSSAEVKASVGSNWMRTIGQVPIWVALVVGLVLAAIAGALVMYLHVPRYEAKSLLMIEDHRLYVAFPDDSLDSSDDKYVRTQMEVLRSPVVLEPALARPEVAAIKEIKECSDPVEKLSASLTVSPVGTSELYNVAYISPSAKDAADIVNAVVEEYMLYNARDDADRARRVIDILEDERLRRSVEVERLRKIVVELSLESPSSDPLDRGADVATESGLETGRRLLDRLLDVEAETESLGAELRYLEGVDGKAEEANAVADEPKLQAAEPQSFQTPTRKQSIAEIERRLAGLGAKRTFYLKRLKEDADEQQDRSAKAVQLAFARANLAREEKVFEMIASRKLALQTEMRAPARVQSIRKADVPTKPISWIPYQRLAFTCLIALISPLAIVIGCRLLSRDEVS